ncbi:MAG TPA: hypothetical protein VHO01_11370 [Jatrophihabitans sp.]|nr:hypothetical protein [Jatrophihabitans sp.]
MPITTPRRLSEAILSALAAAGSADVTAGGEHPAGAHMAGAHMAGEHSAGFEAAIARLDALDHALVSLLLAGMIRRLLELRHPDGFDGSDVQQVLTEAVRASQWYRDSDPRLLAAALMGALTVLEPGERVTRPSAAHAILLIAALLPDQPTGAAALIEAELAELRRAETIELP